MLRTKWSLVCAVLLLLGAVFWHSNMSVSKAPVAFVPHNSPSTSLNAIAQQQSKTLPQKELLRTENRTAQCATMQNDDETDLVKQLLIEPLMNDPNRYDWQEDGGVAHGHFRDVPIEIIAEAARVGDPEAEALYAMHQLQQIPTMWANAFSSEDFDKLDEAEKMLQHANTVSPATDLVYHLRSTYRVAVTVAWLNLDKVGMTHWQHLQRRFQKFDLLLRRSGNDRQFLQSQYDDLETPQVINHYGMALPPLPPPDPQLLIDAERSANDFGLNWRSDDTAHQQKISHWFQRVQPHIDLAISCLADHSSPSS